MHLEEGPAAVREGATADDLASRTQLGHMLLEACTVVSRMHRPLIGLGQVERFVEAILIDLTLRKISIEF